jgi:hypothetical protein
MAEGWGPTAGNAAVTTVTSAYPWVQLHTAAPGSAGTTAVATETTRKQVASWATASGGSIASSAALTWTSIAGSQDATHFTTWTASTAGTFGYSGVITANPYTAGDTLTIASGALTAAVTLAS